MPTTQPEVWQRGPIPDINPYLQPVAHALLQAKEEVENIMLGVTNQQIWIKPAGMASAGFHLQHLRGVLQRLFTYALGGQLTQNQLHELKQEGIENDQITVNQLVQNFNEQVDEAIAQLTAATPNQLLESRGIGRAQIPTNVLGLYVHAAEHTMRHIGQLLVTVAVVKGGNHPI